MLYKPEKTESMDGVSGQSKESQTDESWRPTLQELTEPNPMVFKGMSWAQSTFTGGDKRKRSVTSGGSKLEEDYDFDYESEMDVPAVELATDTSKSPSVSNLLDTNSTSPSATKISSLTQSRLTLWERATCCQKARILGRNVIRSRVFFLLDNAVLALSSVFDHYTDFAVMIFVYWEKGYMWFFTLSLLAFFSTTLLPALIFRGFAKKSAMLLGFGMIYLVYEQFQNNNLEEDTEYVKEVVEMLDNLRMNLRSMKEQSHIDDFNKQYEETVEFMEKLPNQDKRMSYEPLPPIPRKNVGAEESGLPVSGAEEPKLFKSGAKELKKAILRVNKEIKKEKALWQIQSLLLQLPKCYKLAEAALESLPQLLIQIYGCFKYDWFGDRLLLFSIAFSFGSQIYATVHLLSAYDTKEYIVLTIYAIADAISRMLSFVFFFLNTDSNPEVRFWGIASYILLTAIVVNYSLMSRLTSSTTYLDIISLWHYGFPLLLYVGTFSAPTGLFLLTTGFAFKLDIETLWISESIYRLLWNFAFIFIPYAFDCDIQSQYVYFYYAVLIFSVIAPLGAYAVTDNVRKLPTNFFFNVIGNFDTFWLVNLTFCGCCSYGQLCAYLLGWPIVITAWIYSIIMFQNYVNYTNSFTYFCLLGFILSFPVVLMFGLGYFLCTIRECFRDQDKEDRKKTCLCLYEPACISSLPIFNHSSIESLFFDQDPCNEFAVGICCTHYWVNYIGKILVCPLCMNLHGFVAKKSERKDEEEEEEELIDIEIPSCSQQLILCCGCDEGGVVKLTHQLDTSGKNSMRFRGDTKLMMNNSCPKRTSLCICFSLPVICMQISLLTTILLLLNFEYYEYGSFPGIPHGVRYAFRCLAWIYIIAFLWSGLAHMVQISMLPPDGCFGSDTKFKKQMGKDVVDVPYSCLSYGDQIMTSNGSFTPVIAVVSKHLAQPTLYQRLVMENGDNITLSRPHYMPTIKDGKLEVLPSREVREGDLTMDWKKNLVRIERVEEEVVTLGVNVITECSYIIVNNLVGTWEIEPEFPNCFTAILRNLISWCPKSLYWVWQPLIDMSLYLLSFQSTLLRLLVLFGILFSILLISLLCLFHHFTECFLSLVHSFRFILTRWYKATMGICYHYLPDLGELWKGLRFVQKNH